MITFPYPNIDLLSTTARSLFRLFVQRHPRVHGPGTRSGIEEETQAIAGHSASSWLHFIHVDRSVPAINDPPAQGAVVDDLKRGGCGVTHLRQEAR